MGDERARVEKKISRYMSSTNQPQQQQQQNEVSQYTQDKINNLRRFLENVRTDSGFSESESVDDSAYSMPTHANNNYSSNGNYQQYQQQFKRDFEFKKQPIVTEKYVDQSAVEQNGILDMQVQQQQQMITSLQEQKRLLEGDFSKIQDQLQEAHETIQELKGQVEREHKKMGEQESMKRDEYERRIEEQKCQFEASMERNLKFINQIIQDKNELNTQVEALADRLKVDEEKHNSALREAREKFMKELKANKEAWMAAEKVRKEKWMAEKSQEMKDTAMKGLEPEIERIINKNKLEIKRIEEKHVKALAEQRDRLRDETDEKFRAFREKTLLEADELIANERNFKAEKAKENMDRMESAHAEERDRMKRLYEDRLREVDSKRREESDSALKKLRESEERHIEEVRTLKSSHNAMIEGLRFDSRQALSQQKEQLRIEQERWMEMQMEKAKEELARRTIEMRKRMEKERDMQIEVIVAKIADETVEEENKRSAKVQPQIATLHAEYKEQIHELQRQLGYYLDQSNQAAVKTNEIHDQVQVMERKLKEEMKQRWDCEKEKSELMKAIDELEKRIVTVEAEGKKETEHMRMVMQGEVDKLKKEVLLLNKTLQDMDDDRVAELDAAEEKHSNALTELEERVRVILSKKDNQIVRLKEDVKYKDATCDKLQKLLDKQRADLVMKMTAADGS